MRDKQSSLVAFRRCVHALSYHLIFAATADLHESQQEVSTPLAQIKASKMSDAVVLIPVLRSGIGMHEPAQNIFPAAPTIFAGMARDEATAIPHWYYDLKQLEFLNQGRGALILDPMLATGGSAIETVKRVKAIYPKGVIK
jgi:uracil phosphoribosyltransferase